MASGTSWNVIIGSIASSLAILIFITGRSSLADLFGQNRPATGRTHPPASQSAFTRFLNKPIFLIIGILSSLLGIYTFTNDIIDTPHPAAKKESVINDTVRQKIPAPDTSTTKQDIESVKALTGNIPKVSNIQRWAWINFIVRQKN